MTTERDPELEQAEKIIALQKENIALATQAMQIFQRKWSIFLPPDGRTFLQQMINGQAYAPETRLS